MRQILCFLVLVIVGVPSILVAGTNGEARLHPLPQVNDHQIAPSLWARIPRTQYVPVMKTQQAAYTVIDSLFNAFSYYGSSQTPVLWDPQTKAFVTIKRGALPPTTQGSSDHGNNIFILWTTDQGASWKRLGPVLEGARGVLAPNGAPRYPAIALLYGDRTIASLDEAAFAYFSPVTNGSEWIGMAVGLIPTTVGAAPQNTFLDKFDDITPDNQEYLHAYGTTVNTTSFSRNAESVYGFGFASLFPSPQGSAPTNQNNNVCVIKVDYAGVNQFEPMIPPPLRSTNFVDPGSTSSRTNSEVALDIDQDLNLYAGVFGRFSVGGVDTSRVTFGVTKSTDNGQTWSTLNVMPISVIEAYASANGADPAQSGFTFSWAWNNDANTRVTAAKDFVVLGNDRYSFAGQLMLVSNNQIQAVHYVEAYYDGSQWGIRKIADASLFETHPQWAFQSGDATLAPSQLGCELQLSRTDDYSTVIFKTLEAKMVNRNGQDYLTTDVVLAGRDVNGQTWDVLRNATQSDMLDRITWIPKVLPRDLAAIPLLTVQAASREGTEWDYLWTNQFRLAAASQDPTPDEVLRYRQYVTYSNINYDGLPEWTAGSNVQETRSDNHLVISPNPSSSDVTINIPSTAAATGGTVVITDVLGRVLHQVRTMPGQAYHTVDVSRFPSGAYRCRFEGSGVTLNASLRIIR
jgi:hypothetical protein